MMGAIYLAAVTGLRAAVPTAGSARVRRLQGLKS